MLVIDDQRTMRQMVAMIYQKIAFEYPGVTIDCYTALSGEQALRMCREHRFHIVTMDQQVSEIISKDFKIVECLPKLTVN